MSTMIFFILPVLVQGLTTTEIDCSSVTTPFNGTNFVLSPKLRGTFGILWGSLFTIFACTYTVQHLNIPSQRTFCCRKGLKGVWDKMMMKAKWHWPQVKWAVVTIIVPELIMGKAWADLKAARKNFEDMKLWAEQDGVEWSISHSYFANMGGFLCFVGDDPISTTAHADGMRVHEGAINDFVSHHFEMSVVSRAETIPYSAVRSRSELLVTDVYVGAEEHQEPQVLIGEVLLEMRKQGLIDRLPDIIYEESMGKSKESLFLRLTVMFQVIWTLFQVGVRWVKRLHICQVELAVVAFSMCALFTYGLQLNKPKGIQIPLRPFAVPKARMSKQLGRGNMSLEQDCKSWISQESLNRTWTFRDSLRLYSDDKKKLVYWNWTSIPSDILYHYDIAYRAFAFSTFLFGATHLFGWTTKFGSTIEIWLWYTASIYVTCVLPIWHVLAYFHRKARVEMGPTYILAVYVLARLILLVLYFRGLLFLPSDAFVETWAVDFPHFG